MGPTPDLQLDALWAEVEAHPADETKHEAFIRYVVASQAFGVGAERYKALEADNEDDRDQIRRFREKIALAMATTLLTNNERTPAPRLGEGTKLALVFGCGTTLAGWAINANTLTAVGICMLLFGGAAIFVQRRRH